MKYKAIILAIASSDSANDNYWSKKIEDQYRPYFPTFKKVHKQYMDSVEDIKMFFVYGDSFDSEVKESCDLVYDVVENDTPGIKHKTVLAMEEIDRLYDYDFIIRSNMTTLWDLPQLRKRLDTLPLENCLAGTPVKLHFKPNNLLVNYIAGYDMVISKDLVKCLINNKEEFINTDSLGNLEDLTMYNFLHKRNTVVDFTTHQHHTLRGVFPDDKAYEIFNALLTRHNIDHIRCRCPARLPRGDDFLLLNYYFEKIYGQKIL